MANYHGKDGVVKVAGAAVAGVKTFSVTTTAKVADNSAMGQDWETHIEGKTVKSWTATVECNYDQGDAAQVALIEGASIALQLFPEGAPSGAHYLSGTATITSVGISQSKDSTVPRTFQAQGNGPIAWAVL